jgi:hypothetical protein
MEEPENLKEVRLQLEEMITLELTAGVKCAKLVTNKATTRSTSEEDRAKKAQIETELGETLAARQQYKDAIDVLREIYEQMIQQIQLQSQLTHNASTTKAPIHTPPKTTANAKPSRLPLPLHLKGGAKATTQEVRALCMSIRSAMMGLHNPDTVANYLLQSLTQSDSSHDSPLNLFKLWVERDYPEDPDTDIQDRLVMTAFSDTMTIQTMRFRRDSHMDFHNHRTQFFRLAETLRLDLAGRQLLRLARTTLGELYEELNPKPNTAEEAFDAAAKIVIDDFDKPRTVREHTPKETTRQQREPRTRETTMVTTKPAIGKINNQQLKLLLKGDPKKPPNWPPGVIAA